MNSSVQAIEMAAIENCPIRQVVSKFTDKWSMLVLTILNDHPESSLRYSEIRKQMPDCSQKMLSQTLRNLESAHLVIRTAYPEVPPRVEYHLSDLGRSLMPHILALTTWAIDNFARVVQP